MNFRASRNATCLMCGTRLLPNANRPTCAGPCEQAYQFQLKFVPHTHTCKACGRPLMLGMTATHCQTEECRRIARELEFEEQEQNRNASLQASFSKVTENIRASLAEADPLADPVFVQVRYANLEATELRRSRRTHFRANLEALVEQHWTEEPLPDDQPAEVRPASDTRAAPELSAVLCGTCTGACCQNGDNRAYLDREVVYRFRQRHPDATPETFIETYMARLPERTYERSCIFHSERGCGLTRELRSVTYNAYACSGLVQVQRLGSKRGQHQPLVVLRGSPSSVVAAAVIDETGSRPLACDALGETTSSAPSSGPQDALRSTTHAAMA